jgi:hypothetical protein
MSWGGSSGIKQIAAVVIPESLSIETYALLRSRLALRVAGTTKRDASGVRRQLVSLAKPA